MIMGRIKGWKRIEMDEIDARKYLWKSGRRYVVIWKPKVTLNRNWVVRYPSTTRYAIHFDKEFKTLNKAYKFAINWMQKHPRG